MIRKVTQDRAKCTRTSASRLPHSGLFKSHRPPVTMAYHANSKLSLNTTSLQCFGRGEDLKPSRRRAPSSFSSTPTSPPLSSPPSSFPSSINNYQASGSLPLLPIDSEQFPLLLESDVNMYKVPGQNVYFVPYGGSPAGPHPAWSAPATPPFQPFPESTYYPGQPRTYFEDMNGSRDQLFAVPRPGYDTDPEEEEDRLRSYASDGDKRSRRNSRGFLGTVVESRPYTGPMDKRHFRPPPSVSPANSSATDESGRSSSYGSTGSGRSVRWTEGLVAPTPEPSMPRPKGWFNKRGDQLWCNDGRYKAAVHEYPRHLRDYPEVGEGWMNEHGVRISITHRRMPTQGARPPKGVLKNNASPIGF